MGKTVYNVMVSGVVINEDYLTEEEANRLYDACIGEGHDDVEIVEVDLKLEETKEYWD